MAKTNSAFMKPHTLSPELEAVVGKGPMPRSEVVSKMWVYIKAHNLQDPKDKKMIVADEKLLKVFGGEKTVHMMKMAGHISKHLS
jgi:chromatin remodeling complex protein RSC6